MHKQYVSDYIEKLYLKRSIWLPVLFTTFLFSCRTTYVPVKAEYEDYIISVQLPKDTSLIVLTQPYRDSVNSSMNEVVGWAEETLDKKQPEGALGNFFADALLHVARQKFGVPVDAAFVNYGGIRINQLAKGEITRGEVFEIMPFDNLLVLQQVKGNLLQQYLDFIAGHGGWPMAGITMEIKNKKAVNVHIGGQPLDETKTYMITNSDYIANGGDNAAMLKNIPQQNIGYLMRDALFDYIKFLKAQGKNVSAPEEKRITNAE